MKDYKLVGLFLGIAMTAFFLTGCDFSVEQAKVVAKNAGLFSMVGWVALDNPEQEVIQAVGSVLDIVKDKAEAVTSGETYTDALYSELEAFVLSDKVKPQYRPLCLAGTVTILGGIDMLFAANPSWKENQDTAVSIVSAFLGGAKLGLAMRDSDPVMQAARNAVASRARLLAE